jgi:hypothetical protein
MDCTRGSEVEVPLQTYIHWVNSAYYCGMVEKKHWVDQLDQISILYSKADVSVLRWQVWHMI